MRVGVIDRYIFPNGTYIFDKQGTQINPDSPQGKIIQGIVERQVKAKVDSLPQKYRAEVAHNIDINNDGVIGKPEDKPKPSKKKKTHRWN